MLGYLILVALFILVVISVIVEAKLWQQKFKERFPPITDEEFLARCTPGTNPEIALKVRRIVAEQLCIDYERIYPDSRFVEDLGCD